jgi:hypothetical protein
MDCPTCLNSVNLSHSQPTYGRREKATSNAIATVSWFYEDVAEKPDSIGAKIHGTGLDQSVCAPDDTSACSSDQYKDFGIVNRGGDSLVPGLFHSGSKGKAVIASGVMLHEKRVKPN